MKPRGQFSPVITAAAAQDPCAIRGLSFRQPWCDAILHGGKRIENRLGWRNCSYRGEILIHASNTLLRGEHEDVVEWARDLDGIAWTPPAFESFADKRGGFVGRARIIGTMCATPSGMPVVDVQASHRDRGGLWWATQSSWWMGGFGLILDDVRPIEFIAFKAMLGLFQVPADILTQVREVPCLTTTTSTS